LLREDPFAKNNSGETTANEILNNIIKTKRKIERRSWRCAKFKIYNHYQTRVWSWNPPKMISSARQESAGQLETEMLQFRGAGNKKPYTFSSQPQALSMKAQLDRDKWVLTRDVSVIILLLLLLIYIFLWFP